MAAIKIETGFKTYDIEDTNGKVLGQIEVNTSDINFFSRAKETQKYIEDIISDIDESKELTEDEIVGKITEYDNIIKEKVDELFNSNVSDTVFGNQNVFNTHNGVTFVERFFKSIVPVIAKDIKTELEKSQKNVEKYTKMVK